MAESLDKQLERIMKKIESEMLDNLQESVGKEVKKMAEERTQKDLYDAYTPLKYKRTYQTLKGWKLSKNDSNSLVLRNDRPTTDKHLWAKFGVPVRPKYALKVVEKGSPYIWDLVDSGWRVPRPADDSRPVVANTKKDIDLKSKQLKDIYKKHLKSKGYNVK